MPTLLRLEGFRFFFFSREGKEPAHVHVEKGDGVAKFWLRPVKLDWSRGLKVQELSRVEEIVVDHRDEFEARWNEYFSHA
ncbi:MAG: DUF4160 domain-containing protein [Candidatus Binatia bacterium]